MNFHSPLPLLWVHMDWEHYSCPAIAWLFCLWLIASLVAADFVPRLCVYSNSLFFGLCWKSHGGGSCKSVSQLILVSFCPCVLNRCPRSTDLPTHIDVLGIQDKELSCGKRSKFIHFSSSSFQWDILKFLFLFAVHCNIFLSTK